LPGSKIRISLISFQYRVRLALAMIQENFQNYTIWLQLIISLLLCQIFCFRGFSLQFELREN